MVVAFVSTYLYTCVEVVGFLCLPLEVGLLPQCCRQGVPSSGGATGRGAGASSHHDAGGFRRAARCGRNVVLVVCCMRVVYCHMSVCMLSSAVCKWCTVVCLCVCCLVLYASGVCLCVCCVFVFLFTVAPRSLPPSLPPLILCSHSSWNV